MSRASTRHAGAHLTRSGNPWSRAVRRRRVATWTTTRSARTVAGGATVGAGGAGPTAAAAGGVGASVVGAVIGSAKAVEDGVGGGTAVVGALRVVTLTPGAADVLPA